VTSAFRACHYQAVPAWGPGALTQRGILVLGSRLPKFLKELPSQMSAAYPGPPAGGAGEARLSALVHTGSPGLPQLNSAAPRFRGYFDNLKKIYVIMPSLPRFGFKDQNFGGFAQSREVPNPFSDCCQGCGAILVKDNTVSSTAVNLPQRSVLCGFKVNLWE
jgi:hypothetical protein